MVVGDLELTLSSCMGGESFDVLGEAEVVAAVVVIGDASVELINLVLLAYNLLSYFLNSVCVYVSE